MASRYRGRPGKQKAQRKHAARRAEERFGIRLGDRLRTEIIAKIQRGEAKFVERQSLRISVWDVTIVDDGEDVVMRTVYDKDRKEIVTFLWPEGRDRQVAL